MSKLGSIAKYTAGGALALAVGLGGCVALVSTAADNALDTIDEQATQLADAATITQCEASGSRGEVTVSTTNPLDEEKGFIVYEVSFLNADGAQVGSANVRFENLAPGQAAIGSGTAFDIAGDVVSCEIADTSAL